MAITYELSTDLFVVKRQVYTLLEYLGDLGGLAGALHGSFTLLVKVFLYKASINYISLHTVLEQKDQQGGGADEDIDKLTPSAPPQNK